jgi:putative SOS response-associated peptidase YedK
MCGRFASYFDEHTIVDAFGVDRVVDLARPSFNVAPTQPITLVRQVAGDNPGREARTARWGLIPSWSKDPAIASRLINARSESVTVKPSFRSAAKDRRAVIPAAGYFEWQQGPDGAKTPYYLHTEQDHPVLALAGLYEWWRDPRQGPNAPLTLTATVITRAATDALGQIHDRMPLVVPSDLIGPWLSLEVNLPDRVEALIRSMPDPVLTPRRVSRAVGSVRNNSPNLIQPADA